MIRRRGAALAIAVLMLGGCAGGSPQAERPTGYLDGVHLAALRIGDAASAPAVDAVVTQDRMWMAIAHAELRPAFAAGHFDCALGARLSGAPAPALKRLFARLAQDVEAAIASRYTFDPTEPCVRASTVTAGPGGRATALGAAYAGALALAAPDRAEALKTTGRAIGESAVLCGLASDADTVAGAALGAAVIEAAAATPAFRADLAAARIEVDAVRASGLTSPACAAERRALAQ